MWGDGIEEAADSGDGADRNFSPAKNSDPWHLLNPWPL